jgi:hypothetical protein
MWTFIWLLSVALGGHDGMEPTDRLVPPGWKGNPWGPEANRARETGLIPAVRMTSSMKQWDTWGKTVLRNGDILFRRGDAKLLRGHFPFSRFIANVSGSPFSHTGIASIEKGDVFVYDMTKAGVRRQPFCVWILDNAGPFGVKRLRPEYQAYAAKAVRFCHEAYNRQVPFDYELSLDDRAFYCVEMTEKAYRNNGLPLADPLRLADMENITKFPLCVIGFSKFTSLQLDQLVYFPGNERHGIWSSPHLMTVYAPPDPTQPVSSATSTSNSRTSTRADANAAKPPVRPASAAGIPKAIANTTRSR